MAATSNVSAVSCTNHSDQIVTFNIGGQIYSTLRSTIDENVDSQSFLSLLIKNQTRIPLDANGRYFLDRDGRYFAYILNYFRQKNFAFPENISELKELFSEAKFYQIDRLINEIENRLNRRNEKYQWEQRTIQLTVIYKNNETQRMLKLIGPLNIIVLLKIQAIGERFLRIISSFNDPQNILCRMTFPFNERLISCEPLDQLQKFVLAKQAKKMGLIVSYSEDYFYIPIEQEIISRAEFSHLISSKYQGRLYKTAMNTDDDDSFNLVEDWLLSTSSEEIYSNASLPSVH